MSEEILLFHIENRIFPAAQAPVIHIGIQQKLAQIAIYPFLAVGIACDVQSVLYIGKNVKQPLAIPVENRLSANENIEKVG